MDNKLILIIAAVLLPPLAVFLGRGAGKDLVINIVSCACFSGCRVSFMRFG